MTKKNAAPNATPKSKLDKKSKRDKLAAMLVRDKGATIDQMAKALSWQPHTIRAAMTGLRKSGYVIDSDKMDGVPTYRAIAPE